MSKNLNQSSTPVQVSDEISLQPLEKGSDSGNPDLHPNNKSALNERRREQNRQAQREFRDRKEKYQRELESQVAALSEKHNEMVKSYATQSEEVDRLKKQIEGLTSQLLIRESSESNNTWSSGVASPHEMAFGRFFDR